LKNNHDFFQLYILKYCDISDLIKWEQYYIDQLQPEYNILKYARSSLGFKHSNETILKLKSKKITQKYIVILFNKKTYLIHKFNSIKSASEFLNIDRQTVTLYLKTGKVFQKTYVFIKLIIIPELDFEFEKNNKPKTIEFLNKKYISRGLSCASDENKLVEVKNIMTNEIKVFPSIRQAARFIPINHTCLTKYFKIKGFYSGRGYYVKKCNGI
jgi:hypothetical protein